MLPTWVTGGGLCLMSVTSMSINEDWAKVRVRRIGLQSSYELPSSSRSLSTGESLLILH